MTIRDAIRKAKENYNWTPVRGEMCTVFVGFTNNEGREDETAFDLGYNPESELEDIWMSLHHEFDADFDAVNYVETHEYGYEG